MNTVELGDITLVNGDCLEVMDTLPENSVDTCITDNPYELGFMGKHWDASGISFQKETWEKVLRVLKPGGMLLAFGGTRTFHRIVCAIEDAGFEIRDTVMWVYGSGFPKSHNISKAIDKHGGNSVGWFGKWLRNWRIENNITQKEVATLFPSKTGGLTGCVANWELGFNMPTAEQFSLIVERYNLPFGTIKEAEREVVGKSKQPRGKNVNVGYGSNVGYDIITAPSTPEAQLWDGWGTALKPAVEPICVAMKPRDGTFAQNALKWGVAGLNIDGGRVGTEDDLTVRSKSSDKPNTFNASGARRTPIEQPPGRFPANLIHDGSDEVMGLFPDSSVTGKRKDPMKGYNEPEGGEWFGRHNHNGDEYNDNGSAARFFYCAKASRAERNAGLEELEEKVYPKHNIEGRDKDNLKNYLGGKPPLPSQNSHPTVKPIALMEYLVRLTKTPTGGVVLDPFMGSGTTGIACVKQGRKFIGIEKDPAYYAIAEKRIAHEQRQMKLAF